MKITFHIVPHTWGARRIDPRLPLFDPSGVIHRLPFFLTSDRFRLPDQFQFEFRTPEFRDGYDRRLKTPGYDNDNVFRDGKTPVCSYQRCPDISIRNSTPLPPLSAPHSKIKSVPSQPWTVGQYGSPGMVGMCQC
eukprot:1176885-Prorocentrum_minimum.AAC.4